MGGWTTWEAVQLANKLEAKQAMAKTDWECWKILEEGFGQFHGTFLFDLDDDDQEDARQDKRIKQRWTVKLLQHGQEMDVSHYSRGDHDLCSKETKGEKEKQDRENCNLGCGKWWKVNQGGGRGWRVQGHTVASGSMWLMKSRRTAQTKKTTMKETKPTMKPQTTWGEQH